jgi:hypothetical protein
MTFGTRDNDEHRPHARTHARTRTRDTQITPQGNGDTHLQHDLLVLAQFQLREGLGWAARAGAPWRRLGDGLGELGELDDEEALSTNFVLTVSVDRGVGRPVGR